MGESLLCCTSAGGVYVVPILELTRDADASPAMRVLASRGPKPASALWWYRALEPEREDPVVAICVGVDGEVRAWDVKEGVASGRGASSAPRCASAELARARDEAISRHQRCSGRSLDVDAGENVARGEDGDERKKARWRRRPRRNRYPTPRARTDSPRTCSRMSTAFARGGQVTLSVQETGESDGYSLIAALIDRRTLELYDVDRATEPKSTHALPNHTVAVHVTEDLIFALVREPVFR